MRVYLLCMVCLESIFWLRRHHPFQCPLVPRVGGEGVRRNALRVLRPKSPHSEEIAQYIEWRDPCGHAAVWLQGSAVQGRHDRLFIITIKS